MIFHPLEIPGAYLLQPQRPQDRHGFFARNYCRDILEQRGLDPALVRSDISVNKQRGTVHGMHYQTAPYEESQLVRCTAGVIFDVIVDLRHDSPTYKRHVGAMLKTKDRQAIYIPPGVGHGYQTLEDDSEVFVQSSEFQYPECARGVRWNDPALAIEWPEEITEISESDLGFPDLEG